jgi:hypothetical protein
MEVLGAKIYFEKNSIKEYVCLLGCCAVQSGRGLLRFQRCRGIALTMEAASTFETSVKFYQTAR